MSHHVILVAFAVEGENLSRDEAAEVLLSELPRPGTKRFHRVGGPRAEIESWWQAEDDRIDGSDNDSAVFVRAGNQRKAHAVLVEHDLTSVHNDPDLYAGPCRAQFEEN